MSTLVLKLSSGFAISDSATNVVTKLVALQALVAGPDKLGSIALTGTNPILTITAGMLAANSAALGKISTAAYTIAISSGLLTAAQFIALSPTVTSHVTAGVAISDTTTNVVSSLDALQARAAAVASIALTDTSHVLSLSVTQLVNDSAILLKISGSYSITVSGIATAAQVAGIKAALIVKLTAGFTIADTAAHIVSNLPGLLAYVSRIASITLTDSSPVLSLTATQLIADAAVLTKITGIYNITLSGSATAAQVVGANTTLIGKLSTGFVVSDTAANVANSVDALQARASSITSITLTDGSPVLSLTATKLVADSTVLLKISGTYSIAVSGTATATQAATVRNALIVKLGSGLVVSDTAAAVVGNLANLQVHASWIASISLTDNPAVVSLTAAQLIANATALLKIGGNYSIAASGTASVAQFTGANLTLLGKVTNGFVISDSAANLVSSIDALQAHAASIHSVGLTDNVPTIALTTTQFFGDATVLLAISGSYKVALTGLASVAQITSTDVTLLAKITTGFAVSDSADHVFSSLDSLQSLATSHKLASILLTDSDTPNIEILAATLVADAGALTLIQSPYTLTITDGSMTAAQAAALPLNVISTLVTNGLTISDTAGNVFSNLTTLEGLTNSLNTITLTNDATAAQAVAIADSMVATYLSGSINVTDSGTNVVANLDALFNNQDTIGVITLLDSSTPLIVTATALITDGAVLGNIVDDSYMLTVSDTITAAVATSINADYGMHLASAALIVSDTADNMYAARTTLVALHGALQSVTVMGSATVDQAVVFAALSSLSGTITVTDTASAVQTALATLEGIHSKLASITATGGTVAATAAQMTSDSHAIALLNAVSLSGAATVAQATTIAALENLFGTVAVSDTASAISDGLNTLEEITGKITSISLIDDAPVLSLSVDQLIVDAAVLLQISGSYVIALSDTALAIQAVNANILLVSHLNAGFAVSDNAANVLTHLDALQALAAGSHLGTINLLSTAARRRQHHRHTTAGRQRRAFTHRQLLQPDHQFGNTDRRPGNRHQPVDPRPSQRDPAGIGYLCAYRRQSLCIAGHVQPY